MASTSSRMLALLSLLQSRRDWPGHVLADRLEVSPRTVRRDVERLRELGYRVKAMKGPDGGYRLDAGSELPPLLLDDEQALALAVALQTAPLASSGLDDAAARALSTMQRVMPTRLRDRLTGVHVQALPDAAPSVDQAALRALSTAIRDREVVRFAYVPTTDAAAEPALDAPRRVEPHDLVVHRSRWYLVGWDLDRDDWRIFRVDRIALRTHGGGTFARREPPFGSALSFVAARFSGADGSGALPCVGEVIVAAAARVIRPFLDEASIEELGAQRTRVVIGSWSWRGLASSLGALDAEIEVVGPPELAQAFGALAERYARAAG